MLRYLYYAFETMAFVTLLFQYKKMQRTNYAYFLPYLIFIFIYETGSLFDIFNINHSNAWITNIVATVEFLFFSFFLINLLDKRLHTRLTVIVASVFLFTVVDVVFIQGFWNLCTIAILLQYVVLIILVCFFFYQLMHKTGEHFSLISLPDFWVNTGLLFFCLAEFLFFAAFTYMMAKKNYNYSLLWFVISNIANLILYSCLSISFLCFSKTRKLLY
jgi:hypothetical protein